MDRSLTSTKKPQIADQLTIHIQLKNWTKVEELLKNHKELSQFRYSVMMVNGVKDPTGLGGSPFLNVLVEKAPLSCITAMVKAGASLESRDNNDNTPLTCAMIANSLDVTGSRLDVIRYLLDQGADPKVRYKDGIPAYLRLSVDLPEDIFERFFPGDQPLAMRASGVPWITHYVRASLDKGSQESRENLRSLFLDKEAEVNPDFERIEDLPLAAALERGSVEAADLFLSLGARLDVVDERGRGLAFAAKNPSSVYWLEQKSIELLEQIDDRGMTPLRHLTGLIGQSFTGDEVETVKAFIACGCDVDAIDKNGPHYSLTPRKLIENSKIDELCDFLTSIESCRSVESILREIEADHRSTFFAKKSLKIDFRR